MDEGGRAGIPSFALTDHGDHWLANPGRGPLVGRAGTRAFRFRQPLMHACMRIDISFARLARLERAIGDLL